MQQPSRITKDTPVAFSDELPDAVDVAIIGGGVIGVFAALFLARMGSRVFLCEKGRVAGEQSSRNWGWIRQQGRDPAELPIMKKALELWDETDRQTGGRCGFKVCGISYLASTEESLAEYNGFLPVAREHGVNTRALTSGEIGTMFSGQARRKWVGGIITPSDARGEPWQAVPAVARLANEEGALIRENCAARALDVQAGQVRGIVTEHGTVKCDQVVLAAGAWSSLFARRHGINIPQLAVRNTVAQTVPLPEFLPGIATDEQLAMRRREDGGYTLAPAYGQIILPGPDSFRHFGKFLPLLRRSWKNVKIRPKAPGGFPDAWGTPRKWSESELSPFERWRVLEPAPDSAAVRHVCDQFQSCFPDVGRPEIRSSWAGMIDVMPDVVPIVDRVPDLPGMIIATGMSGHGFGIGPGFGYVVAHLAAGRDHSFDLDRFRFNRFNDGSPLELGPTL